MLFHLCSGYERAEAVEFAKFLQPMLNLIPDRRATASACLAHDWLRPVLDMQKQSGQVVDPVGNGSSPVVENQ